MSQINNITMKKYNGTDFDIYYPKTSAEQVDGLQTRLNAKSNKSNIITGQLTVAGWSSNVQTLTFSSGTLPISGYAYTVSPASASFSNYTSAQIYADDVTTADTMVFHCTTTPTAAINIIILKTEVA